MTPAAGARLFADRNFRLYSIGSVISWLSFFVQTLAVSWLAWDLTHSPGWLGVITFLDAAPYFIFGPWGSVFADRHDRHKVLYGTYCFALAQALLLALASATGTLGIYMLGALAFLHGTIHAFSVPAAYGLLPRVVDKPLLASAIAFSSAYRTMAMFAGPALAGLVLATCPVYMAFVLNAGGYIVFVVCLRRMRLPPPAARAEPKNGKENSIYQDYVEGLRYSLGHPVIGMLLVLSFFNDGLRVLTMRLLPAYADKLYSNGGPDGLALLAGVTGIGAAAASVWLSRSRAPERTARIILWSFLVGIGSTLVFISASQPWVALAARLVFGVAAEAALTATVILLQGNVDETYRSRVMGLWFMVSQVSNVSLLAIGPLAERFGLNPPLYVFCGLASGVLAVFWVRVGRKGLGGHFSANW